MENLIDDLKLTWQLENGTLPINRQEQNIVRFLRELSIDILNRPEYENRMILFECSDNITDETKQPYFGNGGGAETARKENCQSTE